MGGHLPGKRILVVDDDPSVMQTFVLVLRAGGFDASGEVNASAALQRAELHHPDILLCDVQLGNIPGSQSGVELALAVLNSLPRCRIVLMSGDTSATKVLADARERGCDFEVLPKPMPPKELLMVLGAPAAG